MINTYMEGYKLFIDTSGFIALLSKKEKKHMEANTFFRYIIEKNIIQITTNLIISETYTFLRYHENHHISYRFLESIRRAEKAGFLLIIYSCSTIEKKAMEILKKFNMDKHFYITGRTYKSLNQYSPQA